jgi:hypothetical protein
MLTVPALTPATIPLAVPTVATAGLLLVQIPPAGAASVKAVDDPGQVLVVPVR